MQGVNIFGRERERGRERKISGRKPEGFWGSKQCKGNYLSKGLRSWKTYILANWLGKLLGSLVILVTICSIFFSSSSALMVLLRAEVVAAFWQEWLRAWWWGWWWWLWWGLLMSTAWIRKNDLKLILFDISNLVQAENLAVMQTGRPYSSSLRFGAFQTLHCHSINIICN